tara:strand:+ start:3182 stop:3469 length:288 start_codon:yes stop_codon:yes gene_type:complete
MKENQPSVHMVDIKLEISTYRKFKNGKEKNTRVLDLKKEPVLLYKGDFPDDAYKVYFFKRTFDKKIKKGKFEDAVFKVLDMSNKTYLSDIAYNYF